MKEKQKVVHMGTYAYDVAHKLYDKFTHNQITADDIVQMWCNEFGLGTDAEVQLINENNVVHLTDNGEYAVIFDGNEYCDIYKIKYE